MIGILDYADNPFDSRRIRTERLTVFGADAAAKLEPGYPDLSGPIQAAVDVLTGKSGQEQVNKAEKEADTDDTDTFLDEVEECMRDNEAQLIVALGKESAAYLALYPNGIQTYSRLRKTEAPARFDVLKKIMDTHGRGVPDELRSRITGFKARWAALRNTQDGSEGQLNTVRTDRKGARAALEDALFVALLDLSKEFRHEPARLKDYFDHTLLDAPRHASLERNDATPVA